MDETIVSKDSQWLTIEFRTRISSYSRLVSNSELMFTLKLSSQVDNAMAFEANGTLFKFWSEYQLRDAGTSS